MERWIMGFDAVSPCRPNAPRALRTQLVVGQNAARVNQREAGRVRGGGASGQCHALGARAVRSHRRHPCVGVA